MLSVLWDIGESDRLCLLCTVEFYVILVIYRMERCMEWVLVSLMWLFALFIIFVIAFVVGSMVWLIYMVSKLFKEDDPYTFENDGEP